MEHFKFNHIHTNKKHMEQMQDSIAAVVGISDFRIHFHRISHKQAPQ